MPNKNTNDSNVKLTIRDTIRAIEENFGLEPDTILNRAIEIKNKRLAP